MALSFAAWQRRIFAVTWLAYAAFYFCRKNFTVAMPAMAVDLGYSKGDFASVLAWHSGAYCLAQFAFGLMADRAGAKATVLTGLAVSVAANLLMAGAGSLWMFVALGFVNGAGQASGWPGLVKNVGAWLPAARRGVLMGWWSSNYMVGGFASSVLAAWLIGGGWRQAFVFPALMLAAVGAIYAWAARNRPEDAGFGGEEASVAAVSRHTLSTAMLRDPAVWLLAVGAVFAKVTRYTFMFWLPLYLAQELKYGVAQAGVLSSVYELAGPLGSLAAGYASDHWCGGRRMPVAAAMFALLALACWAHPALAALGLWGVVASLALAGALNNGPDALLQGAAAQDLGAKWGPGSVAGFIAGFAALGQLASPILVALVAEASGWDGVFRWLVGLSLAGAAVLGIPWRRNSG